MCLAVSALSTAPAAQAVERPVSFSVLAVRTGPSTAPGVVLTARMIRSGKPVTGRVVTVQVRTAGTAEWRTAKRTRTGIDGSVRIVREDLRRAKEFRIRYRDAASDRISRIVVIPVVSTISVTASSTPTPTAGDEVRLSGTASAALVGARVHLQLLVGDAWRSVSSSTVGADGGYSVRAVATLGGDQRYRAMVDAAPGRPQAVSAERTLTVYAWYRLARVEAVAGGTAPTLSSGRLAIAGKPYVDALGARLDQGGRATTTWSLRNRCLRFRSTIGPDDASDPGFYGVFRARADDDVVVDAELDRGSTKVLDEDITGASALQLVSAASSASGDPSWGDPEVLCAGI